MSIQQENKQTKGFENSKSSHKRMQSPPGAFVSRSLLLEGPMGRDSVVLKSELYRHKSGAIDPSLVRCTIHRASLSCLESRNQDVQRACAS